MPKSEAEEVAALTALAPWMEREGILELLRSCGGDAEVVRRILEDASNSSVGSRNELTKKGNAADQKKKTEKYFVGGGPSSGQVVLGDDGGVDNVINSLFEKTRQQGNYEKNDSPQAFFGRGRRLGYTAAESPFIAPTLLQRRDVVITVYRDGYSIDKGPRLDKQCDEGVAFFRALEAGLVPDRISKMYPNTAITAHLVDYSQQDAPLTFLPFAGEGRRLTGDTSGSGHDAPATAGGGGGGGDLKQQKQNQQTAFKLYEGEETAKVAIVNFHGKRLEFTVNPMRHTVGDIYALASLHAEPDMANFQLVIRDIPPRPLTDRSISVDEAKLRNATVMMRKP